MNYWNKLTFPWHSNLLRCTCIYISAVKVNNVNNALTQIPFNGTHFINVRLTQRVFSVWPVAQPVVGEMEMHSFYQLSNSAADPFSNFFPLKKAPKPYLVSENRLYCRARSCFPRRATHLCLSICLLSFCSHAHSRTHISSPSLSLSSLSTLSPLFSLSSRSSLSLSLFSRSQSAQAPLVSLSLSLYLSPSLFSYSLSLSLSLSCHVLDEWMECWARAWGC